MDKEFSMDTCPYCHKDLTGEPIPKEYLDMGYYAPGSTHYSRLIGIEEPEIYDGIIAWKCPECRAIWPRKGFEWGFDDLLKTLK